MRRDLAPLATAKITAPVTAALVDRPRLFRELDRARRAVWIAGPPGGGKTALVATYLQRRRARHAWYQIDSRDGDLAAFIHYLGLLARRAPPRAGEPLLATGNAAVLAAVARRTFERVLERAVPGFVLVVEDLHQIAEDAPLHVLLPELLASIPARRRVVLTSRREPPPSLARLRASDMLSVLSWDALQLTPSEARAIVKRRGHPRLDPRIRARVVERAEGWAAGLVLQLDAATDGGPGSSDHTPGGALFDYFAAEILASMSGEERVALLRLSVVPVFTTAMAADISAEPRVGRLLDQLTRRPCFLDRHAGPERIYRFHPLLRAFLRSQAATTLDAEALDRIHRRAAEHLAARGEVETAALLLAEATAWEDLERLIVDTAPALTRAGRERTVLAWLDRLPVAHLRTRPWLAYWMGAAGLSRGFAGVREHLRHAIDGFEKADDHAGLSAALARMLDSYFLEWGRYREIDPWIDRVDRVLEEIRAGRRAEAPELLVSAFRAMFYRRPDHPRIPWLRDRLAGIREEADPLVGIAAGLALSYYYSWMGQPAVALSIIETAQERLRAANAPVITRQTADYLEALALLKLGDGEGCLHAAARALDRAETTGVHLLDFRLHSMGVYGAIAVRDLELAARRLDWMGERLDGVPMIDVGYYRFLAAWHAAVAGNLPRADVHSRQAVALADEAGLPSLLALSTFLAAQLDRERGDLAGAEAHLARARAIAGSIGSESLWFMVDLLAADFRFAAGDAAAGDRLLREALVRGRERRLGYYAGWRPTVMARLCVRALERGIETEYVRAFIRAQRLTPETPPLGVPGWPWPVEVRALGPLTVCLDGRELRGSGKAQMRPLDLLAALVAFGGRDVPMDRLVDALWPEAEGDAGRAAIDTTILRLRRLLDDASVLIVDQGRLSLDPHRCWLDTWMVERLLGQLERSTNGQTQAVEGWLDQLAQLCRGPLLMAHAHAWAIAPRERLRRRVVEQFEKMGRALEAQGDLERALGWYLRGLAADELADGLYQGAARCHRAAGRERSAVALVHQGERVRQAVLGEEMGQTD